MKMSKKIENKRISRLSPDIITVSKPMSDLRTVRETFHSVALKGTLVIIKYIT